MSRVRTVLATTLLSCLAFGQAGCSAGEPTTAAAPTVPALSAAPTETAESFAPAPTDDADDETTKPTKSGGSSREDGPILSGKRQVVIKPAGGGETILAVDDSGKLVVTDGPGTHSLFVFVPVRNGLYQIRTAKADVGGEPSCMGVKNNGSKLLTVVAAACDTRRTGQLFRVSATQEASRDGYGISNQGAYLQISPTHGLVAEELGDAPLRTVYTFVDNGDAPAGPGE